MNRTAMSTVTNLKFEYGNTAFSPVPAPRLSWRTGTDAPNWRQHAAEVEWVGPGGTQTAHLPSDESVLVTWPFGDLTARASGTVRVRVEGPDGWSEWSDPLTITAGFLADDEWHARFIGLPEPATHAQPARLRREFDVRQGLVKAYWYATAHGVYQTHLNGRPVDDHLLKPGWTPYRDRLVLETTDVTALLTEGRNALGVDLAGGWFCESFGFQGQAKPFYGVQPAVAGQLCLVYDDGIEWITTDDSWRSTADGPLVSSGIYAGESYDARRELAGWASAGFDDAAWVGVRIDDDGPTPGPRFAPPVRVTETVGIQEVITSPSGKTLLDFGQNLVGRLRLRVDGPAGTTITLRHAEVLEHGELGVRPLRVAKATDTLTLAGSPIAWAPEFTFHGFRYAEVTGWPGELDPAAITAEVIGSDMERTGWFSCSHPLVNQLHDNVVWGMRGNFLALPTDCPQRDERLGWTGDIQVFSPTAGYLFDCDGFLASWLVDLAIEQAPSGSVPFVVPDVLSSAEVPAAAWGDASTVVPTVLWERFGDRGVVETQYPSMKAWADCLWDLAGDQHLWEGGFQFGDWLDPDAPPEHAAKAKADPDLVATAHLIKSSDLVARAAALLGNDEDAATYAERARLTREAWLATYVTPNGRIVSDAQTAYALALRFDITTDPAQRQTFGDRLAWLARRDGYRIGTGFVGTPLVTDALTDTGHAREASRMLLQTQCPSWLYPITMGATTIWERWDSMLPDGSINPGEMTSFNHYALGAVADWLHRRVAGLAPGASGYRRIVVEPVPLPGLDAAEARHLTPYGLASVAWERQGDRIALTVVVPPNADAEVRLPGADAVVVGSGEHTFSFADPIPPVKTSAVTPSTPLSEIMDDPDAYAMVMSAFEKVAPHILSERRHRRAWVPNLPLSSIYALASPSVGQAVEAKLASFNAERGH